MPLLLLVTVATDKQQAHDMGNNNNLI